MANSGYATVVNIDVDRREGDYWVLTSEDLPGFLMCGKDRYALGEDIPNVIKGLFRHNYGKDVSVILIDKINLTSTNQPESTEP